MAQKPTCTVGELKKHLEIYPDDMELNFGGLDFYRVKMRGENILQIEFEQVVYKNESGKIIVES